MRKIKFRGRNIDTGEFVFSGIVDCFGTDAKIGYWVRAYGAWELRWEKVDPESVVQFVGYDKNGKEVYEGDVVFNPGIMGYQDAQLINNYDDEHIILKEDD